MIDPAVQYRLQPGLYRLEGVRCSDCGHAAICQRTACSECGSRALVAAQFRGHGRLLAWTNIARPPLEHGRLGAYPMGLVELDEGPRVLAKLADVSAHPPNIGVVVEVVLRRLFEPGPDEMLCYGYKFRVVPPVNRRAD